jgi:Rieske Fe-S protein
MRSDEFPISADEDNFVARREFTKLLGLTSVAFLAGTLAAAARKLWKGVMQTHAACVSTVEEVPVGGYRLFRYPTDEDPCILIRLEQFKFAAFNQNCTHLSCPVIFNAAERQFECPCHKGFFSGETGQVLAGPPKRALQALNVSLRDGRVWVNI